MKTGRWLAKRANDRLGDGERAREPGRFNPEQVYQTAQPVVLWGLDDEIRSGLARPAELGPNSGIIGHQRAIGEPGPIGPNPRIERVGAPRVDVIGFVLDPFDIRAEAHPPGKVEGHMGTQSAIDRRWIYQPGKYRPA